MAKGGAINRAVPITAGSTNYETGELFIANCTVAGDVNVRLESGDTHIITVAEGYNAFPYRVKGVTTSGTTATATYSNLISG